MTFSITLPVLAADLAEADVPARLVEAAAALGGLHGLVMSHCESVDSSILNTTVESWDRHFQVNARAAWLLIKAFAEHLPAEATTEVRCRRLDHWSGPLQQWRIQGIGLRAQPASDTTGLAQKRPA